jgi:molybdopterin molybdotransferase
VAFGLPGNPLAHFVCLNLYVREALRRLAGDRQSLVFSEGRLVGANQAGGPSAHETLAPARFEILEGQTAVTPLPWRSSGDLTSLATANALVRIPEGADAPAEGARVQFLVI